MAVSRYLGISDAAFIAGNNFSACQFQFVSAGSVVGEVVLATGTCNPIPIGIIQNAPSTGQEAQVRVLGFSKLVCNVSGCNLNWRNFIQCASDGHGEAASVTGSPVNALYLDTSVTSGSVIAQVYLFPMTACFAGATS
jgi:hypothetical protein